LRSGVAGLGQGGFFVNTTEHLLFYRKGELPKIKILSFQQLELKTMKRYNRIVTDFGKRELVREFISKSNGCPVRVYKHSELQMNSIPLKDFEKRESAVRKYYSENIGVIFRGNQVQKENSFQIDIISNLEKDGFYSVDYIPSRGKNEDKETTLYYFQKELLSWLSDTSEAFEDDVVKSNKMTTLWDDIPKADIANEGQIYFPRSKKPEQLIKRIIEISTLPGDIVLDSFLGSGTTAAVAHKMGRRWIGIELGEHCYTHCVPRLRNVVSGTDQGGVSKAMDWKGGGGFKTFRLAPSLLAADEHAMLRFNPDFTDDMVAEAVAKIEGFTYSPDPEVFWKQSRSSEQDYLLVTKIFVTAEWLAQLHEQMAEDESLLLCCPAYGDGCERTFSNITLKKIPNAFMRKYEFGKDDYSLNVQNVIGGNEEDVLLEDDLEEETTHESKPRSKKGKVDDQPTLF
jgi:adenine-specific DNA-methyltransferase